MSKTIIFALVVVMAVTVLSAPTENHIEDQEPIQEVEVFEELLPVVAALEEGPQARVTCDLLSGIGWAHSFCAAHCLFLGYKGGSCNSRGVCECRR